MCPLQPAAQQRCAGGPDQLFVLLEALGGCESGLQRTCRDADGEKPFLEVPQISLATASCSFPLNATG